MMERFTVFDYKVARTRCEDEIIYKSPEIVAGLNKLFSDPNLCPCLDDQNGEGISTFRLKDYFLFKDVDGIEPFKGWFENQAILVSDYFGKPGATGVTYFRAWTNKIFKGCSGNVHDHDPDSDAMAVFYPLAPEGSADFAFVKDGWAHARNHEILPENISWQNIKEGDLIIHETRAWHTVSEHQNDIPRIVFVIEFSYTFD
jgi:hypothetical protein